MFSNDVVTIVFIAILTSALTTAVLVLAFNLYLLPRLRAQLETSFDGIIDKANNQLRSELDDVIDTFLPKLKNEVSAGVISAFKEGLLQQIANAAINPGDTFAKTSSSFINAGMDAFIGKKKRPKS